MQVTLDDYSQGAVFATELVNTSPLVRVIAGDMLTGPQALKTLLDDNNVHPDALVHDLVDGSDLEQVRALREVVREILDASSPSVLVDLTRRMLSTVRHHVELVQQEGRSWRWNVVPDNALSLADELALFIGYALLGTLRTLGFERFRPCSSPTCNGVFVDTSRGGRRRYCMPALCGNRINVANHRQRKQRLGDH